MKDKLFTLGRCAYLVGLLLGLAVGFAIERWSLPMWAWVVVGAMLVYLLPWLVFAAVAKRIARVGASS